MSQLGLALRVLRAEGARAVRDRLLDRLAARRRRRRYRLMERVGEERPAGGEWPREAPQVAVLNVLPTPPRPDLGGVALQLLRRLEAEAERRPVALLYPQPGGYRLEIRSGARREAVEFGVAVSLDAERLFDAAFAGVVRQACRFIGARIVHFEQLVGLPLRSVAELGDSGLRQVLSLHDFGLFCLRPHLLEHPRLHFCGYCREPRRCARCLACDWRLAAGFQQKRREIAHALLRSADAVLYSSAFLRRTYHELMPGLDTDRHWIVEPPSVTSTVRVPQLRSRHRIRHLAYVGGVQPHKGALVLEELIRRLGQERRDLRWSVYGGGDRDILRRLRRLPAVRIRGYYRAGSLPRMLRRDGVDLALLLSIVPESYALTLDECLLAGVPVLAFDHGALAERLAARSAGVLVASEGAGAAGAAALAGLRELLDQGWRPPAGGASTCEPPSAAGAAEACRRIYCRLLPQGDFD